jgi:hypothetical protein
MRFLASLLLPSNEPTDKGMVRSDRSKPALIFLFTARVHTTNSNVKILAANTHCKYFLKIPEHCQYCNLPDHWRNVHPLAEPGQYATLNTARRMLNRSRDTWLLWALRRVVQTSDTSGSAYRKISNFCNTVRRRYIGREHLSARQVQLKSCWLVGWSHATSCHYSASAHIGLRQAD